MNMAVHWNIACVYRLRCWRAVPRQSGAPASGQANIVQLSRRLLRDQRVDLSVRKTKAVGGIIVEFLAKVAHRHVAAGFDVLQRRRDDGTGAVVVLVTPGLGVAAPQIENRRVVSPYPSIPVSPQTDIA